MNGAVEIGLLGTGLKTAAMLLVVLAVMIGVLYVMKKFSFFQREPGKETLIKVISARHLSPKARIEVIEISGERMVIGITPERISFLTGLKDADEQNRQI